MSEFSVDELIDQVLNGENPEAVVSPTPWRKKSASQRMHTRRLAKKRKHKVVDPKRSRIMKKAMRKWAKSRHKVARAARRRQKY